MDEQHLKPIRDPQPMLERTIAEWGGHEDLWVFAYGSLIWRPDFDFTERRPARLHGWHRALKMWSRINRGTPQCPGLVFGLLSGGSCQGVVFRIPASAGLETLGQLWLREMMTGVYDPRWLPCVTSAGRVRALAFTLSRRSPNYTGELPDARYREIFAQACGRYGTSLEYAMQTLEGLRHHGIHDAALARLIRLAEVRQHEQELAQEDAQVSASSDDSRHADALNLSLPLTTVTTPTKERS
ncbi:gamma-glutamylcyclotransferase [Variovorax dokdonensis]|uniref:glutathione-specific gamma-glutamylcyclotransferase n=1 Tax=Variovorax dokdonensis TaxID=344883 RepID=A0ABT7N7I6_9BURK|nr:gamma-glutamylcyclotransferase [Variovorax dokdonensis]MDM0043890.1 gamma-glutamylcyclotransferase [Variovorax dokdonensis]